MGPNLGVPLKVLGRDTQGVIGLRIARKIRESLSRGYGGAFNYRGSAGFRVSIG